MLVLLLLDPELELRSSVLLFSLSQIALLRVKADDKEEIKTKADM